MRLAKSLFVLLLAFVLFFGVVLSRQAPAVEAQGANLLQNPGFEGSFQAWSGIPEIQVASGWTPWWLDDPSHSPAYFRPEYKRADAGAFPYRVFSGGSSQQYFTFFASHLAGMYQQVPNVTPGQRYRFSIVAQVWSSLEDDARNSVSPANPHLQIGIDPTGNWSPGSPDVVWSPEASMSAVIDQWVTMSVEATAANSVITVFMRTNPDFANKHNDVYWDNANLSAVEPPPPTDPPPTNTPDPSIPTVTPTAPPPTDTPVPPTPTETPGPTETPTPADTATHTVTPPPTPLPPTETPSPPPSPTAEAASPTADSTEVAQASTPPPAAQEGDAAGEGLGSDLLLGVLLLVVGILIGLLLAFIFVLLRRSPGGTEG